MSNLGTFLTYANLLGGLTRRLFPMEVPRLSSCTARTRASEFLIFAIPTDTGNGRHSVQFRIGREVT